MSEMVIRGVNCLPEEGEGFSGLDADLTGKRLVGIVAEVEESAILLLRILAGLHKPVAGEILYDGKSLYGITEEERSKLIRLNSYIFDSGGLVSNLSVLENISLPYDFVEIDSTEEKKMEEIKGFLSLFSVDRAILAKRPSMLNKSEIKIINYIRAFIIDPEIAFIELPFSRLNKTNEKKLEEFLINRSFKNRKTHIFATQRYSKLLETADAVIAIKKSTATCFTREDNGKAAFDYGLFFENQENI